MYQGGSRVRANKKIEKCLPPAGTGTKIYFSSRWEVANLVVSNLIVCNFHAQVLFWALLSCFAFFCAHLRLRSFALICV